MFSIFFNFNSSINYFKRVLIIYRCPHSFCCYNKCVFFPCQWCRESGMCNKSVRRLIPKAGGSEERLNSQPWSEMRL